MTTVATALTESSPNARAEESFSFGATLFERILEVGPLQAASTTGGGTDHQVNHLITVSYRRTETVSGNPPDTSSQADAPAMAPFKQYRITIEEV